MNKVFEEAICAALGHKKFGGQDFIAECLELFEDEGPCTSTLFNADKKMSQDSATATS